MTTICAIETEQGIVMGGDSLVAYSDDLSFVFATDSEKVWRSYNAVIGFAGSVRIGQVFRHYLVVPDLDPEEEIIQDFMVKDFVTAMRHALEDAGHSNGEEQWTLLVGIDRYLYMVDAGMGVHRCHDGHLAIGSGCPYAISSLYTTKMLTLTAKDYPITVTPEARIHFALSCAARYSSGTGGPFTILNNYPYLRLVESEQEI